jgi:deoxyadenosine/deoxycytidine kinase
VGFSRLGSPRASGRIEVCGGIASGKTTLAQLLSTLSLFPILEDFQANPFWKPFYADPAGTAFETEVAFLLQHYHAIKSVRERTSGCVCDFSLELDVAYARVTLGGGKLDAFLRVMKEVREELLPSDLLIYLRCDPSVELERIRRRGRNVENAITVEYLAKINGALEEQLRDVATRNVLVIDSAARNFAEDEGVRLAVAEEIGHRLGLSR